MKRVTQMNQGDPSKSECIAVQEAPEPSLDANNPKHSQKVIVKVHAASLNPIDYKMIRDGLMVPKGKKFPAGVGTDIAGIVTSVGSGVTTLKVGDEVNSDAINYEPFAELAMVNENKVAKKPASSSFAEATAIPLAGLTAYQSLRDKCRLKEGGKIMIFGGSGGVGSMAIQMAKHFFKAGLVVTTSSNTDMCKELGADVVVNYKTENVADCEGKGTFDCVLDCVGGIDYWRAGKKILKPNGLYVTLCGDNDVGLGTMIGRILWRKAASIAPSNKNYDFFLTKANATDLAVCNKMVEDKKVKILIDSEYEFTTAGVNAMFAKLMSSRTKGKLVCNIVV